MVLSENYNSSNYLFSFGIAEHFPSITDNITRQPARVTAKWLPNATLQMHAYVRCTTEIFLPAYTLYAHISYIGIIYYRYIISNIFCHIINATEVVEALNKILKNSNPKSLHKLSNLWYLLPTLSLPSMFILLFSMLSAFSRFHILYPVFCATTNSNSMLPSTLLLRYNFYTIG